MTDSNRHEDRMSWSNLDNDGILVQSHGCFPWSQKWYKPDVYHRDRDKCGEIEGKHIHQVVHMVNTITGAVCCC